jgi:hypothetical protein
MSTPEQHLDQQWLRVKRVLLAPRTGTGSGYDARVKVSLPGGATPESISNLWSLLCAHADAAIIKAWEDAA